MITKRFLSILGASLAVYFISDYFFEDSMLYIMGGAIGGTIYEISKDLGTSLAPYLINLIWIVLLIGVVVLFFRLRNKPLKYLTLVVIAGLLYVVDFLFFSITDIEITDIATRYLSIGIRVLLKSLILTLIVYYGTSQKTPAKVFSN